MKGINQIPYEWVEFENRPAYFFTYWGDVYFGILYQSLNCDKGFFIVPKHNLKELFNLKENEQDYEHYKNLGWEINDFNVIRNIIPFDENTEIFNDETYPSISSSEEQFKQMFIFGAGASANCCFGDGIKSLKNDIYCPPIGYEIFHKRFDEICLKYPAVKYSIPEFESKGNNIEECLEQEWLNYKTSYNPMVAIRHINIQFYLQELFQEISNRIISNHFRNNLYSLFTNKLQKFCALNSNARPIFVSFNYDTILDSFIEQAFGFKYNSMNDYIDWKKKDVILFKPHGSSNWGWKFDADKIEKCKNKHLPTELYENKIEPYKLYYELLGPLNEMIFKRSYAYEMRSNSFNLGKFNLNKLKINLIPKENDYHTYFPALLLPYRDKDEFVMPYHHVNALEYCIKHVDQLFLIGWKGNEDVFNNKLRNNITNIKQVIIINPETEIVEKNISNYFDFNRIELIKINTFEDFILNHFDNFLNNRIT